MKRLILLPLLFLFASACSDPPTEAGPLKGWDGEVVTDPDDIITQTTELSEGPNSLALSDATTTAPPLTVTDSEGWINPEFVFQARPSLPGSRAVNALYAQDAEPSEEPCLDQSTLQAVADAGPISAFWTDGLGIDDAAVVRVSASSDSRNDGEEMLAIFRTALRCEDAEGGFTTVMREVPGVGTIEVYQTPGTAENPATWTTAFARNNIFMNLIVQTEMGQFDEAIFDRVTLAAFEALQAATFEDQIFAADLE